MIRMIACALALASSWTAMAQRNDYPASEHAAVWLSNDSQAPAAVIREASRECSRIFKNAGIEIAWKNERADSHDQLQIVVSGESPRSMADGVLGYTAPVDETNRSAVVIWPRVEQLTNYTSPAFEILGRAMAHELGHLLLVGNAHGQFGVMRPIWSIYDLRTNRAVLFAFTASERNRMHDELKRRAGQGLRP